MQTIEEYTSGRVLEDTKRKEKMVDKIRRDPEGEKELKEEVIFGG